VALDDLREWLAFAREEGDLVKGYAGYGFDVPAGDARAFAVLWSFSTTLPFARRLRFEKGIRALERRVDDLRDERSEWGQRWWEWNAARERYRIGYEDAPDFEDTIAQLERIRFEQEAEAERACTRPRWQRGSLSPHSS